MKNINNIPEKPKVPVGDLIANWSVGRFVSFGLIYRWLGTDDAKTTLVDAFDIRFFAIFKAVILLCAMGSAVLCGVKLIALVGRLRKTIRIVDLDDDDSNPKIK